MKYKENIVEENWHSLTEKEILRVLDTNEAGLDAEEVNKRLQFYGENKLPEEKRRSLLNIILHQILNPLIFILIFAASASIAIGDASDAIFIFIVIFLNSALGAFQEFNAEKSASSLQKMIKIKARVRREGKEFEVSSENLVPGDVVLLESGMKVPADIRLFEVASLEIDESFLTGELIANLKNVSVLKEETDVTERSNMAFAGSTVLKGRGLGVVVCTGINTQVGKISKDVTESVSAKPPLVLRMEKFVKQISFFIIIFSIFLAILLRIQGMDLASIFFFVVALAVSAIPEGLPVALTVALSIATKRMAKRNVIVRRLTSVESLGSCTVIASDKTGTLTVNEQTAKIIVLPDGSKFEINGQGYNGEGNVINADNKEIKFNENEEIFKIATISVFANEGSLIKESEGWVHYGDAMDVALLGMSYKLGIEPVKWQSEIKEIGKIPYESERKFSASFFRKDDSVFVGVKGAVETVIEFCDKMSINGHNEKIDKGKILNKAEQLAKDGYRVLAFALGKCKGFKEKESYEDEKIKSLTFYGFVGFIDPLRPEAKASVQQCYEAGIKVIMITGDHPETAGNIARELGIAGKDTPVVTGQMLSDAGPYDSPAFEKLVASTTVFARVSPTQKLHIVDVLIRDGEFVAVTGDGVNDAPALKRANIGVAMGSGTDVAKEVGSMIVIDDNFRSIVAGIEEGRFAYDNVRKVIYLLIATGAAEIILFILSIIWGLPLPLLPVQLLWLNLVTNGIQDVALAFEGGEPDAMKRPPRKPKERIFNSLMIKQTVFSGATIGLIVFGLWFYLNRFIQMNEYHARDLILLLMVFMQNFHVFNARSERVSAFKIPIKRNVILIFGVILAQGIHILSMQIPFMQNVLQIEPITPEEWFVILLLAIPIIIVMEIFKFFNKSKVNQNGKKYQQIPTLT